MPEIIPPAPKPIHWAEWHPFDLIDDPEKFPPIILARAKARAAVKQAQSMSRRSTIRF